MNQTLKTTLKYTTIAGSAVIGVGAAVALFSQPITLKTSAMPAITLLVAISAFSYGLSESGGEIKLVASKS